MPKEGPGFRAFFIPGKAGTALLLKPGPKAKGEHREPGNPARPQEEPIVSELENDVGVLEANSAFYKAFESLDIEAMNAVWDHQEPILCVHPGWPLIETRDRVMESWSRIFDNATLIQFAITGTKPVIEGDAAWVSCTENITQVLDGRVVEVKIQATNLFRRQLGNWYLAHHHGSPVG